jgi:hypothetical protein
MWDAVYEVSHTVARLIIISSVALNRYSTRGIHPNSAVLAETMEGLKQV